MNLTETNPAVDKGDKYIKHVTDRHGTTALADVYDVLVAFNVTCPATQHAVKKILAAGTRGAKDYNTDLDEAINSLHRAKQLKRGN